MYIPMYLAPPKSAPAGFRGILDFYTPPAPGVGLVTQAGLGTPAGLVAPAPDITLAGIIANKPKTALVREFFRQNLETIKSDEQIMFDGQCIP